MSEKIIEMRGFLSNPSNVMIVSPSLGGKTTLCVELLKHRKHIFSEEIHGIVICYAMEQEIYKEIKGNVIMFKGIPKYENLVKWSKHFGSKHYCCIIDDLLNEMLSKENLKETEAIYTRYGHHLNITVITLSQNLFWKNLRLVSLNNHYFFLLKFVRDKNQLQVFGRQLFLGNGCQNFIDIYNDAMKSSKSSDKIPQYLLVKVHPFDNEYQFFTHILPEQGPPILYIMN